MTSDSPTLPPASPIAPARVPRSRRRRRIVIGASLAVGAVAVAAAIAAAYPSDQNAATHTSASATEEHAGAAPLSIGQDALTEAEATLDKAKSALDEAIDGVETERLSQYVNRLEGYEELPRVTVEGLTADVSEETDEVVAQTAAVEEERAEERERERRAAEAVGEAQTPDGARAAARRIAADDFGWGEDQFGCLNNLWQKESDWNYLAQNPSSGAYGIPQSLPGSKMATVASDWQTNPLTQIRWGLQYIQAAYGTPCSAWGHSQAVNWY